MKRTDTDIKTGDSAEIRKLRKIAKAASDRALRESRAMGLTVQIIRNNEIVELYPDGKEKVIKKLEVMPSKVKGLKKGTVLCLK